MFLYYNRRFMLGLDAKAAKATWTVFLVALAIYTIYLARGPIVVFALALFFSYLIAPAVDFCTRYVARSGSRTTALAFVYVLMVGTLIVSAAAIGEDPGLFGFSFENPLAPTQAH